MKRLSLCLLIVGLILIPVPVTAHQLNADNGVSAVVHIPPDDNPVAGRSTVLDFAFSSERPGFDLGYCKCVVSFQTSASQQQTTSIESNGPADSGQANVRFPKAGNYDIYVRGQASPVSTDRFQLHYVLRVAAATEARDKSQAGIQVGVLGLTGLVLLGLVAARTISRGRRYTRS